MSLASIHDRLEKFLNKKQKVDTLKVKSIFCDTWEQAKEKAKSIKIEPGWAIYFIRKNNFVDHIAIVPEQDENFLNLYDALLLNSTPSPMGMGIGPLTDDKSDKSGLRIITAIEYVELYQKGYYEKIFAGPPPTADKKIVIQAGKIAKEIADTGLIDGKPAVYSFFFAPLLKSFYIKAFDPIKYKTKVGLITKKFKENTKGIYCGELVANIWKKAGIKNIPQIQFLKIRGTSSFVLFKWSNENQSIKTGLSWQS